MGTGRRLVDLDGRKGVEVHSDDLTTANIASSQGSLFIIHGKISPYGQDGQINPTIVTRYPFHLGDQPRVPGIIEAEILSLNHEPARIPSIPTIGQGTAMRCRNHGQLSEIKTN